MKILDKSFLVALALGLWFLPIEAGAAIRNIGIVTVQNSIGWSYEWNSNIVGYRVYVGSTNLTNPDFSVVATVTTNRWPGYTTTAIYGDRALYVTALGRIPGGDIVESGRSEIVGVVFQAGLPVPPSNLQLYQVVYAQATNDLPILTPVNPALPSPAATAMRNFYTPPPPLPDRFRTAKEAIETVPDQIQQQELVGRDPLDETLEALERRIEAIEHRIEEVLAPKSP